MSISASFCWTRFLFGLSYQSRSVVCQDGMGRLPFEYRVWLLELAVGPFVLTLSRTPPAGQPEVPAILPFPYNGPRRGMP